MFAQFLFNLIRLIATIEFFELIFDSFHLLAENVFALIFIDRFRDFAINFIFDLAVEVKAVEIRDHQTELLHRILLF